MLIYFKDFWISVINTYMDMARHQGRGLRGPKKNQWL